MLSQVFDSVQAKIFWQADFILIKVSGLQGERVRMVQKLRSPINRFEPQALRRTISGIKRPAAEIENLKPEV